MKLNDLFCITIDNYYEDIRFEKDCFDDYVKSKKTLSDFWYNCHRADWMLFVYRNMVPYSEYSRGDIHAARSELSGIGWFEVTDYGNTLLVSTKKYNEVQKKGADICRKYLTEQIKYYFEM